jgi:GMP synthase (glutamine-hydrolysing)
VKEDPPAPHRSQARGGPLQEGRSGPATAVTTNLDAVARLLVVVPHETDPPARLGEWLRNAGLEFDERHQETGDTLPETLDGVDGLLVLGGPQSALDSAETSPELVPVRKLLRQAVAADLPTLAICLGAQLLAEVGGGTVREAVDGPEVGALLVAKRDAADADPVFGPLPLSPDVIQFHHDEISTLPPGATLLASSPMYANQAFRMGRHVYGLQFHIETTPEIVREWAERDDVGVAASPYDLETLCRLTDAAHADIEEAWAPFAERFADLVRAGARQVA